MDNKKIFGWLSVLCLTIAMLPVYSQENREVIIVEGKPLTDYGEIIIKRKTSENDIKLNIEIKSDGELLVNGKPYKEFSSDEVSLIIRNPARITLNGTGFTTGGKVTPEVTIVNKQVGYLGVNHIDDRSGARITSVVPGSPAEKAGLKVDDVIFEVGETEIKNANDLSSAIKSRQPDEEVTIKYLRGNKTQKVKVKLGTTSTVNVLSANPEKMRDLQFALPERFWDLKNNFQFNFSGINRPRLGIQAQDMVEENGVKVIKVNEDSPAATSGIQTGDIIISFNGKQVKNVEDLLSASKDINEQNAIPVEVLRNGKQETISIKFPRKLKTATL